MNFLKTHKDIKTEMNRRKSRRQTMLAAFKLKGELSTKDLLNYGPGLSSRLHELRKDGHSIVTIYEKPGYYRYVYLGSKDDEDNTLVSVID